MSKDMKWGCWVKPTKLAIENQALVESDKGIFLGYNKRNPNSVYVAKAGTRIPTYWHIDFWVEG